MQLVPYGRNEPEMGLLHSRETITMIVGSRILSLREVDYCLLKAVYAGRDLIILESGATRFDDQ